MTMNKCEGYEYSGHFINLVMQTKFVNDHIEIWTPIHGHVNTPWNTVFFSIWCSWSRNFPPFWKSQFNPVHVFTPTFQRSVLMLFASFRSLLPPEPFLWYFLASILYAVLPSCYMMGVIPVSNLLGVFRQNQSFSSALNASDLTASRLPSLNQWLPAMCVISRSRIRTTYDRE
jgi:hypothetical protein